ncbi:MAG: PIN domain-containing protein [Spirochaetaceae bacterium]|nr:PIN domain-containing protein [Spirochaetaceae bacterium]
MKYVDTNILLRFIIDDNKELADIAENILKLDECHLLPEVIPEIIYVLRSVYKYRREDIAQAIQRLLPLVVVKEQLLTNLALTYFAQFNLDYVDCILLARNKLYGREVATFDKELEQKLATVPSVSLY